MQIDGTLPRQRRPVSVPLFAFLLSSINATSGYCQQQALSTVVSPLHTVQQSPATLASDDTAESKAADLLDFARAQIGVPYRYASADPHYGFDCSGFVNYVYRHVGIVLPRTSKDLAPVGIPVPLNEAQPGDLILFKGTDTASHEVGHVGIVETHEEDALHFLHSSSGKARGVVRSPLQPYYLARFIKVIRVLDVNNRS